MAQQVLVRSGVRFLALFALLAGLLIAPAAVAAPLSTTVSGGELSWGVKASWNTYVGTIAKGEISASAGASQQGSDYVFGSGTGTVDSDGTIDATFSGAVHFSAHDGELDLTLANPRLKLTGSTGTLFVDVTKKGAMSPEVALAILEAPERQISSNQVILTGAAASLTEAGAAAFDNYPAGEVLDPVSATITIAEGSLEPSTDDGVGDGDGDSGGDTGGGTGEGGDTGGEPPADVQASVSVSKTEFGPGESAPVTVSGTGFLPELATGTRPPLMGKASGTYVAFGAFADVWEPSKDAPGSARVNAGKKWQKWAVPEESVAAIGGPDSGAIVLEADGSFTAEFEVSKALIEAAVKDGSLDSRNIGIYTYAGGGANVAAYESFTPLTFVDAPPIGQASVSVSKTEFGVGESGMVKVTGQGFDPGMATGKRAPFMGRPGGAYLVFGAFADDWKPSAGADAEARPVDAGQKWALPADQHATLDDQSNLVALEADGSFTAELEVSKAMIDEAQKTKGDPAAAAKNIGIYTYAGSGATTAEYETYTPLTFGAEPPVKEEPPVVEDPPVVEQPSPAVTGSLHWGVKESWRSYIAGTGGSINVYGGAEPSPSGSTYNFGQKSTTAKPPSARGATAYRGAVAFKAHAGTLDITLREPVVQVTSAKQDKAVLSAMVKGKRVNIVSVDLRKARRTESDGSVRFAVAPTTLLASGVMVFRDNYPVGTAFDPLTFTVGVDSDANVAPPAGPGAGGTPGKNKARGKTQPSVKPVRTTTDRSVPGSLSWGVKGSWRTYLNGRAKAKVTVRGAKSSGSGWVFGQSSTTAEPPSPIGTTSYRGSVNFLAHGGALNLTLSDPSVRVVGGSKAMLSFRSGSGRVDVAALNLAASSTKVGKGSITYSGAPATLLPSGVSVFKNFYQAGEVLDPVTFTIGSTARANNVSFVSASTAATEWKAPATPPATTGLKVSKSKVKVGDTITANGGGFQPNEGDIRVVLYSSPRVLEMKVTADASGRATWSGAMPDVETGKHTLTFQGSTNLGAPITVEAAKKLEGCAVSDASLQWGFKEAFRSYVSGTIADGDWSTSGGASYETPEFLWSKGEGVMNAKAGSIDFDGTVEFSGHRGALDTTILNPTIAFDGEDSATLLLDYSSSDREDAMVGKGKKETVEAVPFVDLDLSKGKRTVEGDIVTIADVPTVFTSQGSAVFSTYQAGDSFDPVSITYAIKGSCDPNEAGEGSVAAAGATESTSGGGDSGTPPWVWLLLAAAIVVGAAAGVGGTLFAVRRRVGG